MPTREQLHLKWEADFEFNRNPSEYSVRGSHRLNTTGEYRGTLTMEAKEAKKMYQFFSALLVTSPKTWAMLRRLRNRTKPKRNGR